MPDLRDTPVTPFVHRIDPFGKYLSFCRVCAQTVATDERESKLIAGEERHMCEGPMQRRLPPFSREIQ
jgi:hypothetical protein